MKVLIQGEIGSMPLTEVFQWVASNRHTCFVNITHDAVSTSIFFQDGAIVYATSQNSGFRFGEFLLARGVLQDVELVQALEESKKAEKMFTRYLIDTGRLSLEDLTGLMAQLVEKILMELLEYRHGSFVVATPIPATILGGPIHMETGAMILESRLKLQRRTMEAAMEKIRKRLTAGDLQLPAVPKVTTQLKKYMEDDNSPVREMAKIVMTDQLLVSGILKIANSPFYSASGQVDSVHLAIARLGMKVIMVIVTAIEMKSMKMSTIPREQLQGILDDALKSAFIASALARRLRLDPEEAFLGGLLHDFGKTVILSLAGECGIDSSLVEPLINEYHAEVGAQIAGRWNYPEQIQELIRRHHELGLDGVAGRKLTILQVTDCLVMAGEEWAGDDALLNILGLDVGTVQETYRQSIATFAQIASIR